MQTFNEIQIKTTPEFYDQDKEVKYFLDMYAKAIKQKDTAAILDMCTEEIRCYDLMTPFQFQGKNLLEKRLSEWFDSYIADIDFTFHSLNIKSNDEMALCHSLVNTSGKLKDGKHADMWTRVTICLSKDNNEWKIFHNHTSEPFDMESMRAVSNLQ